MVDPVLRDGAVGGSPVHRDSLEEVVAGGIKETFVYQLGAVEGAVVVHEGVVVGLPEEAVGSRYHSRGVERYRETIDVARRKVKGER